MKKNEGKGPEGKLLELLERDFWSFDAFKEVFKTAALGLFGSGWVWLVIGQDGKAKIISTQNASNPLVTQEVALIGCDVWEHAYYIDYRNNRGGFIDSFWSIVDWSFVAGQMN